MNLKYIWKCLGLKGRIIYYWTYSIYENVLDNIGLIVVQNNVWTYSNDENVLDKIGLSVNKNIVWTYNI